MMAKKKKKNRIDSDNPLPSFKSEHHSYHPLSKLHHKMKDFIVQKTTSCHQLFMHADYSNRCQQNNANLT